MLSIVLCDDNMKVLTRLEKLLDTIFIKHNIAASILLRSTETKEVLEFIQRNSANVFILDIDLKCELSGLDLASKIREVSKNAYIIFSTGHFEYVLAAYKFKTFDYLPKPVTLEKLEETILRLVDDMQTDSKSYLKLNKNLVIDKNNINYIKKDGMQLIFSAKNRTYKTYSSFNKIEDLLPSNFVRCHKSFIVNLDNISNVEINKNIIFFSENEFCCIGPKYKRNFMEVFNHGNFSNNMGDTDNS